MSEQGTFGINAEEFRDDSMSIKSSGTIVTLESLEADREAYLATHPEAREIQISPPGAPSVSVHELSTHIHTRWNNYYSGKS